MKDRHSWWRSAIAAVLVMVLFVPVGEAALLPAPQNTVADANLPAAPSAQQSSGASQGAPGGQAAAGRQESSSQAGGIAAAPYEKTLGVAASRPAGAAIAPAKQKRRRSIVIRVGLLVGAAVAVGTVVGLSHASPGRP